MKTFVILSVLLSLCLGGKLPSNIRVCKGSANFKECLKDAIEDSLIKLERGIPDLNVPPLQPLHIPSVTIGQGKGAVNVVQNYKNFDIIGLINTKITKIEVSTTPESLKLDLELLTPETNFEADYDFNGRVLLLPIVGKGRCRVTLKGLKANLKEKHHGES